MDKASHITEVLTDMADEGRARQMLRFFKTGPGEYGEGDIFIGLSNPQVRMVVKEAWRTTPLCEAEALVRSPLHEIRLCGLLIMVEQYLRAMRKADIKAMAAIFEAYIALHPHINNWDLVDLSAIKIAGNHEVMNPSLTLMDEWAHPEGHTLWQQRISMVGTWMLIRAGRPEACLRRAAIMLESPHDLLHKAAGWMLREAWKKGWQAEVEDFMAVHALRMPAIMLSYACEKMSPGQRHHWQQARKGLPHHT